MKINTPRVLMLATALMGAGTMLSAALPASAAPRYGRPGNRPGAFNGRRVFNGVVTKVRSIDSFDIRVGGSTYNVYANSRLPRRLTTGDRVRVNGVRQDSNDIRYASVTVIRNR